MKFHRAVIQEGKIVLEADPGLADGQRVEVVILPLPRESTPGEAILRSAGELADDFDFDADLAEIERTRRSSAIGEVSG